MTGPQACLISPDLEAAQHAGIRDDVLKGEDRRSGGLSGRVRALMALRAEGVRLSRHYVREGDRVEIIRHLDELAVMMMPASPGLVAAWCKRLGRYVVNPPAEGEAAARAIGAIFDVCGDLPAAIWTQRSCLAWVRQKPRQGFPLGSRWPVPGDLYQFLSHYAAPLRREYEGLRALAGLLAAPAMLNPAQTGGFSGPAARSRPSEAEKQAVASALAALRAEQAARVAHEARIRRHGCYTPPGAAGLTGQALLEALRADLPHLDGDLRIVTQERIEALSRRLAFARQLAEDGDHEARSMAVLGADRAGL